MDDIVAEANIVAEAITAISDVSSSDDIKKAAELHLESVKMGNTCTLGKITFILFKTEWSFEIRSYAVQMLKHLVMRWDELKSTDIRSFTMDAVHLISEEWALKSETASLISEIVRTETVDIRKELLPILTSLSAGPIQAEQIAMMLRCLPEDAISIDDLEGDRRTLFLAGPTDSLPDIFELLSAVLERHQRAAVTEASRQKFDTAKQHATAVTATLEAITTYAKWAPLFDLEKCGLVNKCGSLLSSPNFRLQCCRIFELVSLRKRPVDDTALGFDSVMKSIFWHMLNASSNFLGRCNLIDAGIDESEFKFGEVLCELMVVSFASVYLRCINGDGTLLRMYLEQVMQYFTHYKFQLHFHASVFLLTLMRDMVSKSKETHPPSGDSVGFGNVEKDWRGIMKFFDDDICVVILYYSFQHLIDREKVRVESNFVLRSLESWSDKFIAGEFFNVYNSMMLTLIGLVTSYKPIIATRIICRQVHAIMKSLLQHATFSNQDVPLLESMLPALKAIVNEFSKGSIGHEAQRDICKMFKVLGGSLEQLLSLKLTDVAVVEVLGRYLQVIGPYLQHVPA